MAPLTGCQVSSMLCAEMLCTAKCCTLTGRPVGERCPWHPPRKSGAGGSGKHLHLQTHLLWGGEAPLPLLMDAEPH